MSEQLWVEVARRCDEHAYMVGVERTVQRVRATGEVFTPTALVVEMVKSLPIEQFAPGKTVLDPACGDGQFLVAAKWIKVLFHGMTEESASRDLFGIDIMRDNVDLCRRRLGGGTVLMGDALDPGARLEGQTQAEHEMMVDLFGHDADLVPAKKRPLRARKASTRRAGGERRTPRSRAVDVSDPRPRRIEASSGPSVDDPDTADPLTLGL